MARKLPKSWTTITPMSKYLAMALFVLLPYVGFYLGMQYQRITTPSFPPTQYKDNTYSKTFREKLHKNMKCGGIDAKLCPGGLTCELHSAEINATGTCIPQNTLPTGFRPDESGTQPVSPSPTSQQDQVFCTQEAKLCADGSYVGRTGSNCEFAACPE